MLKKFQRRLRREGAVAYLVMLMMAALIGIAAYAIDTGHLYKVRTELQNVADASALAAAKELDGSSTGITNAIAMVQAQSDLGDGIGNKAYHDQVEIAEEDIEFGHWSTKTSTWTSYGSAPSDEQATTANGIRITARRNSDNGGAVHTPFSGFVHGSFGDRAVSASATAVGGGPATECGFPMAIADCQLTETTEGDGCGL